MQLRHISPRSSDWVDAMDEGAGGRGWAKLSPQELSKLRMGAKAVPKGEPEKETGQGDDDYGWSAGSASR
jgi:hypothetical protein